jgi:predicted molibdopterin-dependent oxidoreductase YjgC
VAPGQVFMPFHFAETNANQVTQSAFDPISREPNYKQCAVAVQLSSTAKDAGRFGRRAKKSSTEVSL